MHKTFIKFIINYRIFLLIIKNKPLFEQLVHGWLLQHIMNFLSHRHFE